MRRDPTSVHAVLGMMLALWTTAIATAQLPGFNTPSGGPKEKTGSELVRLDAFAVDDAVLAPGTTLLAVRFRIDPKWHIYWKNPGESGTEPVIRISGPEGMEVGSTLWPRPVVFRSEWETTYGYADEATLVVPVTFKQPLEGAVTLTVEADWLVCKELCLFGSGRTTLELRAESEISADGRHAAAMSVARARMPRDLATVPDARIELSTAAAGSPRTLTLQGPAGRSSVATFVPDLTPGVEVGGGLPVVATVVDGRFALTLPLEIEPANAIDGRLEVAGVVLLGNRPEDPAFQVRLPLESPRASPANSEIQVQDPASGATGPG